MSSHPAHVYHSLEEWLARFTDTVSGRRRARRTWKLHIEKNGNVPLVTKCRLCSGKELRDDIKHGSFNPARPSKRLRDEAKDTGTSTTNDET